MLKLIIFKRRRGAAYRRLPQRRRGHRELRNLNVVTLSTNAPSTIQGALAYGITHPISDFLNYELRIKHLCQILKMH